jgi:hypothetical protein
MTANSKIVFFDFSEFHKVAQQSNLQRFVTMYWNRDAFHSPCLAQNMMAPVDPPQFPTTSLKNPQEFLT